jgi:hypothetical protein
MESKPDEVFNEKKLQWFISIQTNCQSNNHTNSNLTQSKPIIEPAIVPIQIQTNPDQLSNEKP